MDEFPQAPVERPTMGPRRYGFVPRDDEPAPPTNNPEGWSVFSDPLQNPYHDYLSREQMLDEIYNQLATQQGCGDIWIHGLSRQAPLWRFLEEYNSLFRVEWLTDKKYVVHDIQFEETLRVMEERQQAFDAAGVPPSKRQRYS